MSSRSKAPPFERPISKHRSRNPASSTTAGPAGNETAVHPDTVYAIAQEHYAYWAQQLGREGGDWPWGYFAENLTIQGLQERALHVGDELLVGSELRLIVTGPRIPCFKVAWRMQRPQSFVREFAASGRTGVYFAVLHPGTVAPADAVHVIKQQSSNPTVHELGAIVRGEPRSPTRSCSGCWRCPISARPPRCCSVASTIGCWIVPTRRAAGRVGAASWCWMSGRRRRK